MGRRETRLPSGFSEPASQIWSRLFGRDLSICSRFRPMPFPILGLHHVTATVADAQSDVDFGVRMLGLRLVKRTVNFDNHGVYHFYYGDEVGRPGTLWTTFPYAGRGVPPGVIGAGQVTTTS